MLSVYFSPLEISRMSHTFPSHFEKESLLACRERGSNTEISTKSLSLECSYRHLCWRDVNMSSILHEIYSCCSGLCCLMLATLQLPTFPSPLRNPTAEIRKPGLNIWILKTKPEQKKADEIRLEVFSFMSNTGAGKWKRFALGPL